MRMKCKSPYLWLGAAIIWMILIFCMSHQKASQSSDISSSITYGMAETVNAVFGLDWKEETLLEYAAVWEHPVRKVAHMIEYAVLAVIFLGNFWQYASIQRKYLWAFAMTVLYAATDECHQLFIEGRSGEFKDVCIDSVGAILGLLAAWGILHFWKYQKRKR